MRLILPTLILGASIAAAAAFANSGVTNPTVQARVAAMKTIGAQVKTLGTMAKGQAPFDAATAQAAFDTIEAEAAKVPDLFRDKATDPNSEALPTIWESYGDFTVKAQDLKSAAGVTIASADDLGPALTGLGATCKACHSHYKD